MTTITDLTAIRSEYGLVPGIRLAYREKEKDRIQIDRKIEIFAACYAAMNERKHSKKYRTVKNPYGDGDTSKKVVDYSVRVLKIAKNYGE